MKLAISVGNSRMDKKWRQEEIEFEDLKKRVSETKRTAETVAEYHKLMRGQQDAIKDVGGFVLGKLKNGRRKKSTVVSRSALTLDMDFGTQQLIDSLDMLFPNECLIYSTHKHTLEKPRLRLLIPLSREVSPDEYEAVARMVAAGIDIEAFDDTTYEASRLMFWPSTSSDGEFYFNEIPGPVLNPDDILAKYKDWHDTTEWPVSNRQETVVRNEIKKQADPLTKEGLIGAFCRTYPFPDVIDTFLPDVYKPSAVSGRYDFIAGESHAGLIIYDGKYAYSHHATDPACGKLLNAFDIVRIHKFGNRDTKSQPYTEPGKLPSFKAMQDMAAADKNVKKELAAERMGAAKEEFTEDNWQEQLEIDRKGNVKDTLDNIVLILQHDKLLESIAFNRHRDGIDSRGELPWKQLKDGWNDSDNAMLKVYLNKIYGIYSPTKTRDAVLAVAAGRSYHPIMEYLDTLPKWDGVQRVDSLLADYFGADKSTYTGAIIRKTLVAAVARIYKPGTKFDSVLILNGPQGIGKSTFFAKLAGKWFSDSLTLTDMRDKAGPEKLQGYWILELSELAGMKKTDIETVKSFISRMDDKYRASYGVNVESHPRQSIIVGSTNAENGFLRDITGNRRFWPVKIGGESSKKPWNMTEEEVRQIWAETLVMFKHGEQLYLDATDAKVAVEEQAGAMESDEREGLVRKYLDTLLPDNWDSMDAYARRNFLTRDGEFGEQPQVGKNVRKIVCNMEIWAECFGKDPALMKKADSYEISAILKRIRGWEKYTGTKDGAYRFPLYGRQRALMRAEQENLVPNLVAAGKPHE